MSFLTSLLWLIAMLAAVAHGGRDGAIDGAVGWRGVAWLVAGYVAALAVAQVAGAVSGIAGVMVGVTAAWRLASGGSRVLDMVFAGMCAGLAAALHVASSVDVWLAAALSLGVLGAGMLLLRGAGRVREAVLMLVAFAGPVVAAAPEVAAGWQSAQVLSQAGEAAVARAIPLWTIGFVALAVLGGALRGYCRARE
jgi:hypothetical protein